MNELDVEERMSEGKADNKEAERYPYPEYAADPWDYYEEYSEWLCGQTDLHICNGDALLRHFEAATRFDDFLTQRGQ